MALLKIKLGFYLVTCSIILSVGVSSYAQTSNPTLTAIQVRTTGSNIQLILKGTGFTSFNTVVAAGEEGEKRLSAASFNGTTAAAHLTKPRSGAYRISLVTTRNQPSNVLDLTINPTPTSIPSVSPIPTTIPGPAPTITPMPSLTPAPVPTQLPPSLCSNFPSLCPTHTYVALGDSLGSGFFGFGGYVHHYEEHIENDNRIKVDLKNRSQIGATSETLKVALQSDPWVRQTLAQADFITFNVGGNDLRIAREQYRRGQCGGEDNQNCLRQAVSRLTSNWTSIVEQIVSLRKNNQVVMRSLTIYNPYVNEDRAADSWPDDGFENDFVVFFPYIQQVNSHLTGVLASHNIRYAEVFSTFNSSDGQADPEDRGLISFDHYHPNSRGHRVVADLLRARLLARCQR